MLCQHVKYEVASDKSGTAGYDNVNKKDLQVKVKTYFISTLSIFKGDCIFLPANSIEVKLHGELQVLLVRG